ncbi:hypothetical protein [Streptomyces sp. NPDC050416]|uniref:hypothetical protein n=1 Tax=Streptomyces sp. NPDC050416 TaxID=3365611 RepID=UPI0037BC9F7B
MGAPGRVTLLDPTTTWWHGTADMKEQFGTDADPVALHGLPVQPVIGENDTDAAGLAPDDERRPVPAGTNRIERINALRANWHEHGIDARLDIVPGTGHNHFAVLPAVQRFLETHVSTSSPPCTGGPTAVTHHRLGPQITQLMAHHSPTPRRTPRPEGARPSAVSSTAPPTDRLHERDFVSLTDRGHERCRGERLARQAWLARAMQEHGPEEEVRAVITAMARLDKVAQA